MSGTHDAPAAEPALRNRPIRSFVLRQGRQTEAQKRAFDLHWPRYGLDYLGQPRDFDAVFGQARPRVLEIGFGNGEQLLFAAGNEPGRDFIGVEVHGPGVGRLLIQSISFRDYPLVQGCILLIAVTYVTMNLLTDLVYGLIDPRIRYE